MDRYLSIEFRFNPLEGFQENWFCRSMDDGLTGHDSNSAVQ